MGKCSKYHRDGDSLFTPCSFLGSTGVLFLSQGSEGLQLAHDG